MQKLKTLLSKRLGVLVAGIVILFIILMKVIQVAEGVLQNNFIMGSIIWGIVVLLSVYMVVETFRKTGCGHDKEQKDE